METLVREPFVAGKFYSQNKDELLKQLLKLKEQEAGMISYQLSENEIIGAILPHAAHVFSGSQTIHFFEILQKSEKQVETFVILHPIHRDEKFDFAGDSCTHWKTPLGSSKLDVDFYREMDLALSSSFHKWEHSAEVILPFIQAYGFDESMILPVGISWQTPTISRKLTQKIVKAAESTQRKICILASSDFTHFESPENGYSKDELVLQRILNFDPEGTYNEIRTNKISVCGFGPIMSLLYFILDKYPHAKAEILARGHSGQVIPSDSVVDYLSLLFYH